MNCISTNKLKRIKNHFIELDNLSSESSFIEKIESAPVCSNCQTGLEGRYCHACGQKAISYNRPFREALSLLIDSWFSLDNRFFHTLGPVFLRPGFLSREFTAGRRVRYTSPLKFYLFTSLFFFFVLGLNGFKADVNLTFKASSQEEESVPAESNKEMLENNDFASRLQAKGEAYTDNPQALMARLMKSFSYMFFFLMPIFALLLKLFMLNKKRLYMEHLIVSVHFHAFGFLFCGLLVLFEFLTGLKIPFLLPVLALIIFLYFILTLRNYYGVKWISAFLRSLGLMTVYSLVVLVVMVVSIVIAIAI